MVEVASPAFKKRVDVEPNKDALMMLLMFSCRKQII